MRGEEKKGRLLSTDAVYEKALIHDDYQCTSCGTRVGLLIHHIDGKGRRCKNPNHTLSNLDTLCIPCHRKIHAMYIDKEVAELLGTMSKRAIGKKLGVSHTQVNIIEKRIKRYGLG